LFVSFAMDQKLGFGQMQIFQLDRQRLLGAQAIIEHQGDEAEITESAKTPPEAGHFLCRKRHDQAARPFQSEAADRSARAAITEGAPWRTCGCVSVAPWNFASVMETV
jgi:hypothetical protein